MMSIYSASYSRIDHRTVYNTIQIEPDNDKRKEAKTIADTFNPINERQLKGNTRDINKIATNNTPCSVHLSYYPTPRIVARRTTSSTTSSSAIKTKIPYPLKTLWTHPKSRTFKRSASLRLRCTQSNLPLIMEPTINETAITTTTAAVVDLKEECNTKNTHETTTTATGERFSSRRKLALISSTNAKAAEIPLKRSLSLRRNFKVSPINSSLTNKTDSSTDKICINKTFKSLSLHDVQKAKDQGDGLDITTTTMPETLSTDTIINENVKVNNKMSLNQNGVDTQQIVPTTTTQPQTRPLTLATSTTPSSSSGLLLKGATSSTPKTPNSGSQTALQTIQQRQQHQQQHHHHHQQHHVKTSPGFKLTPKTPPVTPDSPTTYLDDDLDSLFSYGTTTSGRSTMSCEHPYVARNGTTFSGRKMKYVVHCSNYAGQVGADYLTPTQRAQRQLRRLKELLCAARQDLEQKDSEILRLTREVVELRLFKASLSSPEERSASSDAVTVREAELKTSQDVSPIVDMVDDAQKSSSPRHIPHQQHLPQSSLHHHHHHHAAHNNIMHLSSDMQSSFADSGHFEDMTSSSVHSKDSSYAHSSHDAACGSEEASCSPNAGSSATTVEQYELQRQELIRLYEQRIEDMIRSQDAATSDLKRTNCDRIEALLQKLAECNTRYADIVPDYEHAKERIRELEKQLEDLQRRLIEHEDKQKQMYLNMYQKGQEAERIARADLALELAHRAPQNSKVSINELLHQLQSTQDELENIRAAECRNECGNNHALLTAKEAISLWVLGARKTIYRRLLEAQKNRTHVDPEVTLQFLKSAVYYFLTDKENSQGHLQAIESILEFSEAEKQKINQARQAK